ncbi:MAG: hypothetical protein KF723_22305 [Rhizobiaceae bacterium]|nr:hypothetical protein [Rhizobiaceae bacterium]
MTSPRDDMSRPDSKLLRAVAEAICRVQLNGGDPNQPAMRWNGTECEPQGFPAWFDYRDEARHALAAFDEYQRQVRATEADAAERAADAREG